MTRRIGVRAVLILLVLIAVAPALLLIV